MDYKLYSMPHCEKCEKIKDYLKSKNISAEEIDLGDDDGVALFRKVYPKIKDKLKRTEDGQLPVPIFVAFEGESVSFVANTVDEVSGLIK